MKNNADLSIYKVLGMLKPVTGIHRRQEKSRLPILCFSLDHGWTCPGFFRRKEVFSIPDNTRMLDFGNLMFTSYSQDRCMKSTQ